ncbi:MAG: alpha/beta hydrolase [Gemmatimonadaceae bacterium]
MQAVLSRDGTSIVYDRIGKGRPVILVDGALCHRAFGPSGPLAALLAKDYTVFTYDRRGRGASGDTAPYAVAREVDDIAALIDQAGGAAFVYGISSGAALALEAAQGGLAITKLALYEAPFIVDDTNPPLPGDYVVQLDSLIAAGRRGDAVAMFMKTVGVPAIFRSLMRLMPAWSKLKAVAHTLPYDMTIVADNQRGKPLPVNRWASVTVPTLVVAGGKSPPWMQNGMRALGAVLPNSTWCSLQGQTHMVKAKALAPVLTEFFAS